MIYNAFPFFDELDVLEIRLRELWDIVDRFVLVEAIRTFTNQPKPLYYAENRRRFYPWWGKITHMIVSDLPGQGDNWSRERHQRNFLGYGLIGCDADDVVCITDGDEVPRAAALAGCKPPDGEVWQLALDHMFCWFNMRGSKDISSISKVITYRTLCLLGGPEIAARATPVRFISDGGWHFAYQGGVEGIRRKLGAFCHQEYNCFPFTDPERVAQVIAAGEDPLGRDNPLSLVPDDRMPACVQRDRARYAHLLHPATR